MKVAELMKRQVQTCNSHSNLEEVAMLMWNYDCGAIPVVNDAGMPTGMITDRDITMGSAFDHKALRDMVPQQVINHQKLLTCKEHDNVQSALEIMQQGQVHRLPVVDEAGFLKGILSMDDLILASKPRKGKNSAVSFDDVMVTLKDICAPVKESHRVAVVNHPAG